MVKSGQPALVDDSQRQQVAVRDLRVPQQAAPIDDSCLDEVDAVRPEGMLRMLGGLGQASGHLRGRQRPRVGWLRHVAYASVLRDGARCPSVLKMDGGPSAGCSVRDMRSVEQCNQHVDVQQGTHGLSAFDVAQLVNRGVGDRRAA